MRCAALLLSTLSLGACSAAADPWIAGPDAAGFPVTDDSPSPGQGAKPATQESKAAGAANQEELAKQLSNPVAALISVPFQFNYDHDIGPGDGRRLGVNIQPVIPITLTDDWNLISRTILPVLEQDDVPRGKEAFGLGDTVQSLFASPADPTSSGWIWGAGPVFLLPTATDETLGAEQWGLGPTGVALRQEGPWTYGALANQIWSVVGDDDRADVSATFVQPFLTYTTKDAWTFALNTESTYDWEEDEWSVPINLMANKIIKVGGQLMQVGGGVRYWAVESDGGPEGWGLRLNLIWLFPK